MSSKAIGSERIAYVMLINKAQPGVASKFVRYANVSRRHDIPLDFYWICNDGVPDSLEDGAATIMRLPTRSMLATRWYQSRIVNQLTEQYDAVVLRYPLFDPVLGARLRNRFKIYTEHHTFEVPELRLQRDPRWITEYLFGASWMRGFAGIVGVTPELVAYEVRRLGRKWRGLRLFVPNTIDMDDAPELEGECYSDSTIEVVMMANFRPWHGLETAVNAIWVPRGKPFDIRLHVVGEPVSESVRGVADLSANIVLHGAQHGARLAQILREADLGVDSLNLRAKSMSQATAMKVREYLKFGLPVLLGQEDPAFDREFPFVQRVTPLTAPRVREFASRVRGIPKAEIRRRALPFIDAAGGLRKLTEHVLTHRRALSTRGRG